MTREPVIWIILTGTEILQGHYSDRNGPWLSARLLEAGFATARHLMIADKEADLRQALSEAAGHCDLLITSGGLGPTGDDLTRQLIAEEWGAPLVYDEEALERIRERFRIRGRVMTECNAIQAYIPQGATILQNDHGTAPGFFLKPASGQPRAAILALPGPPRELQPMFSEKALPLVVEAFGGPRAPRRTLTFHTVGLPESLINDKVKDLFESDPRVNFALLASLGKVDVRLTLQGEDEAANERLEEQWRALVHKRLGSAFIYAEQDVTLEQAVLDLACARSQTLAVAESCTGGLVAGRLTDVPGASKALIEGFVTYSNEAKAARLGVARDLIDRHGSVSEEVAAAMADGARRVSGADWAVSLTGIAGPEGGTPEKPVGLVWIAVAGPGLPGTAVKHRFIGDRADIRTQATTAALDMLRRGLAGLPLDPQATFDAN